MGDEGLEPPQQLQGKTALSETGGTESGTLGAQTALIDPDLQSVVEAWSSLSDGTKKAILALVRSSDRQST